MYWLPIQINFHLGINGAYASASLFRISGFLLGEFQILSFLPLQIFYWFFVPTSILDFQIWRDWMGIKVILNHYSCGIWKYLSTNRQLESLLGHYLTLFGEDFSVKKAGNQRGCSKVKCKWVFLQLKCAYIFLYHSLKMGILLLLILAWVLLILVLLILLGLVLTKDKSWG